MKKHLLFALALTCGASLLLTSCHKDDDEDDDSDYVADYSSPKVNTNVFFDKIAGSTGVSTFVFSDVNGNTDIYHYNIDGPLVKALVDEGLTLNAEIIDSIGNNFYGGFCPTWYAANDEDSYFTPRCGTYHSGSGALLCNPGEYCRAIFSKHMTVDFAALTSYLTLKSIKKLYVALPDTYTALLDTAQEYRDDLEIAQLPKNTRIEFLVYGYVDSFRFNDFKSFLTAVQSGAKQAGQGGVKSQTITLAETDANGKVTLLDGWAELDLTQNGVDDCYIYEAYIRVVDTTTGKESTTYTISNDVNTYLGYVLVDDITYASKSLF
ncbi:MAG: hypothetical protein J6Y82_06610 [Bacteroidales bacterium]|nr:hypothetical protein [Bacteroidales bacterium]